MESFTTGVNLSGPVECYSSVSVSIQDTGYDLLILLVFNFPEVWTTSLIGPGV